MGTGNFNRRTYLKISKGKVRQHADKDTPGAVAIRVEDEDGNLKKIRYELQYDFIEGVVTNVDITPNSNPEYPDMLSIEIGDGIDNFTVQVSVDSSLFSKLLNKLCNPSIDWKEPITILPYYFSENTSNAIVVKQHGNKIEAFFTKENPNGCPQIPDDILNAERTTRNKKEIQKYMIDIVGFIQDYFFDNVIHKIIGEKQPKQQSQPQPQQSSKPKAEVEKENVKEEYNDDLPF